MSNYKIETDVQEKTTFVKSTTVRQKNGKFKTFRVVYKTKTVTCTHNVTKDVVSFIITKRNDNLLSMKTQQILNFKNTHYQDGISYQKTVNKTWHKTDQNKFEDYLNRLVG